MHQLKNISRRIWRKDLAAEFQTDVRTVDRWKEDGTLPKPKRWHGRPYWTPAMLKKAERIETQNWNERERERNERAAKLRKAKLRAKVKSGKLNPQQLALNLF